MTYHRYDLSQIWPITDMTYYRRTWPITDMTYYRQTCSITDMLYHRHDLSQVWPITETCSITETSSITDMTYQTSPIRHDPSDMTYHLYNDLSVIWPTIDMTSDIRYAAVINRCSIFPYLSQHLSCIYYETAHRQKLLKNSIQVWVHFSGDIPDLFMSVAASMTCGAHQ